MRLLPDIGYGTGRYPARVARQLRGVNLIAWCSAAAALAFGLAQALAPARELALPAAINLAAAALFAGIPLLHRFGRLAAPVAIVALAYGYLLVITPVLGTGSGLLVYFILPPPLIILVFDREGPLVAAGAVLLSAACMLGLAFTVPWDTGVMSPEALLASFGVTNLIAIGVLAAVTRYVHAGSLAAEAEAERERARSDRLLLNILPAPVAARLREAPGEPVADLHPEASVLFADMAGFTARADRTPPRALVALLNGLYGSFDALIEQHGLEKIKTSGDGYLVVSGLPAARADHATALVRFALDLRGAAALARDADGLPVPIRIGIASGPVVAGIVGTRRFFYDVWGDTVNMAARMEATGEPGCIHIAASTRARLGDGFRLAPRGTVAIRGKGEAETWFVEGRADRPEPGVSAR
jgi:adenylate cyclase